MESHCEIWKGNLGFGSWHKRYLKLINDHNLVLYDK